MDIYCGSRLAVYVYFKCQDIFTADEGLSSHHSFCYEILHVERRSESGISREVP